MNKTAYSDFLRKTGHIVVETESALWFGETKAGLLAFPPHTPITPSREEFHMLFRHCYVLRYCPATPDQGSDSYFVARETKPYDLTSLTQKARNQTRRALENWTVQEVSPELLIEQGLPLNRETLARQGRKLSDFSDERWRSFFRHAAQTPGFQAWAAMDGEKIGAAALSFYADETAYIIIQRSSLQALTRNVNNALSFEMTRSLLSKPGIERVFYGMRPLAAEEGLDHFKLGMGYEKIPMRETFSLSPVLRGLLPFAKTIAPVCARLKSDRAKKFASIALALE